MQNRIMSDYRKTEGRTARNTVKCTEKIRRVGKQWTHHKENAEDSLNYTTEQVYLASAAEPKYRMWLWIIWHKASHWYLQCHLYSNSLTPGYKTEGTVAPEDYCPYDIHMLLHTGYLQASWHPVHLNTLLLKIPLCTHTSLSHFLPCPNRRIQDLLHH